MLSDGKVEGLKSIHHMTKEVVMKRLIGILVVAVLALTLVSGVSAAGDPPPALSSGIQLQNRSETDPASVLITYYDDTGVAVESDSDNLAAGASKSYFVPNVLGAPDGRYSVVVSSSEDLFALVNEVTAAGASPYVSASHSGFSGSQVGSPLYLPWVTCEYYEYNSMFAVQNAGSAATNITVDFYQSGESTPTETYPFTSVQPGGAVFLDMTQEPYNSDLAGFFGSVVISSDGDATPLAAVLNDTDPNGSSLRSYNAVTEDYSSTDLVAAQVQADYYDFSTGMTLQNPDPSVAATVAISFYKSGASSPSLVHNTTIAPSSSKPLYLPNLPGMGTVVASSAVGYNGTAVVHSSIPLIGIANHAHSPVGPAASYNMTPVSHAAQSLYMPQINRHYYDYESGYQLYNVGPDAVDVTVTFVQPNGTEVATIDHTINADSALTYYLGDARGDAIGDDFNGGAVATITSGNGGLIGLANFVAPTSGDYLLVYNGFY
jgi:hypothetical protein